MTYRQRFARHDHHVDPEHRRGDVLQLGEPAPLRVDRTAIRRRFAAYVRRYGPDFVDVIHADGGRLRCEFSSAWSAGETIEVFARRCFGHGRLKRVSEGRYVVLR